MGRLSTHVLDNVLGRPASGVEIELFAVEGEPGAGSIAHAARTPMDAPMRR